MRVHRLAGAGLMLFSLSAGVAVPQPAPPSSSPETTALITAEIVGAGAVETEHVGTEVAPDTSLGTVSVVPILWVPDFLPGGTRIQARVGTNFGVEVLVQGADEDAVAPLRTRVTHPPMTNPQTSKTATVEEWDSPMDVGIPRFAGWAFDHSWELVPGVWRIEILEGDRSVAAQEFEVTVEAVERVIDDRVLTNSSSPPHQISD